MQRLKLVIKKNSTFFTTPETVPLKAFYFSHLNDSADAICASVIKIVSDRIYSERYSFCDGVERP